ncbi:TlpA family protein disulfide reductase [Arachidicoccus ginsenosidimutans]|uniref:TlpA family protein disulfide reductase n=1 Tax=Arachidicoccus sp. BS20 TaxID=1850526 RepID=UPI0018D2BAD0|nr:TlpA disulfide reductase family protein [Arachidicoccus sp. BS20]
MTKYVFADTSGNTHTLKEFKGKYILVDMWASWCIPCINEFPSLDSLKQEFKGKNIAFVQISCDRQRQRWYNQLYWSKRTGIQFFINGDMKFMQDLKIATIPRYFLIDKNGKLLNGNMPKASDPETKKILLQLKGI